MMLMSNQPIPQPTLGDLETLAALASLCAELVRDPERGKASVDRLVAVVGEQRNTIAELVREREGSATALAADKAEQARSKAEHDAAIARDEAQFADRVKRRETDLTAREVAVAAREKKVADDRTAVDGLRAQFEQKMAKLHALAG
jgi:hypothetical protein